MSINKTLVKLHAAGDSVSNREAVMHRGSLSHVLKQEDMRQVNSFAVVEIYAQLSWEICLPV